MNVKISKISNGLIVVSDPMPQLESAAVGVYVNAGARNEERPIMGISHMLEHMAFKGTKTRTARAIVEEIEAVGGFLNAYTSREQTAFHARVLKSDVPLAVDILADILTAPTFETAELERERQVVLQEIGQARDTPDEIIFDYLQAAAYPDQPVGWSILGEEETVSAFRREDLAAYMAAHYRAGGMALIGSGAVDHEALVDFAEEKLSAIAPGTPKSPAPALYQGGESHMDDDLEQCHIAYGFPAVSMLDPDYLLAQVYVTALGGGMSSRLFQEVREKRGLCYSIYAFFQATRDDGLMGIYTGTGESEAAEIGAIVAGEMASLAETASEEEVARAKAQLKSSLFMGLERPSSRAELIASHIFTYDRVLTVEEMTGKLAGIGAGEIRRFGEKIMNCGLPSVATVGPAGKLERYGLFAARFGNRRTVRAAE